MMTLILAAAAALPFAGFLIPGALTWLLGGGILRTIATGVVVAPLAFGAGYWKGHRDGDNSAELRRLNAIIVGMEFDALQKELADKLAADQAAEAAKAEQENATTTDSIDDAIAKAPPVSGCIAPGFLDGLRRLK